MIDISLILFNYVFGGFNLFLVIYSIATKSWTPLNYANLGIGILGIIVASLLLKVCRYKRMVKKVLGNCKK